MVAKRGASFGPGLGKNTFPCLFRVCHKVLYQPKGCTPLLQTNIKLIHKQFPSFQSCCLKTTHPLQRADRKLFCFRPFH